MRSFETLYVLADVIFSEWHHYLAFASNNSFLAGRVYIINFKQIINFFFYIETKPELAASFNIYMKNF